MTPLGRHGSAVSAALVLSACTQPQATSVDAAPGTSASQSILVASRPAGGSTVTEPVNELMLHFSPPAALNEVTLTGPSGTMPMMVSPVGEVEHYSLPLQDLEAGAYTVSWRVTSAGTQHMGSFNFRVQ